MGKQKPFFSLIVPTLNRSTEVFELLASLVGQTFKDFEVIVVDQNDDDRLETVCAQYAGALSLSKVKQPKLGASAARNRGMELAQGAVYTFPDDDCTYPSDLLQQIHALFTENPDWAALSITARDQNNQATVARFASKQGVVTPFNILKTVIEAGIFVRASRLNGARFDVNLGVGSLAPWWSDEGADFILHLLRQGDRVMFIPDLYIFHPNPVATYDAKAIERSYRYGCGRGRLLRKQKYPAWFVAYTLALYPAGMVMALGKFDFAKFKYYLAGQKGRLRGYFASGKD